MTATNEWHTPADIWRLLIVHRTELTYPDTVVTSYNEARMQPADDPSQAVLSSRTELDPFEGTFGYFDYYGTKVIAFDVHRPHRHLSIAVTSTVETFGPPARNAKTLSWDALAESDCFDRFEEFLTPTPLTELNDELEGLAEQIRAEAVDIQTAAMAVCERIRSTLKYEVGATGVHTSGVEAWNAKRGVCQDFSHLACGLLRAMGVPARYVSGYLHPDEKADIGTTVTGQSHAWVEWFDGDWVSFDPTNGSTPGHAHVVVGRGRDYRDVPPMKGVYAGPAATGNDVTVQVTRIR